MDVFQLENSKNKEERKRKSTRPNNPTPQTQFGSKLFPRGKSWETSHQKRPLSGAGCSGAAGWRAVRVMKSHGGVSGVWVFTACNRSSCMRVRSKLTSACRRWWAGGWQHIGLLPWQRCPHHSLLQGDWLPALPVPPRAEQNGERERFHPQQQQINKGPSSSSSCKNKQHPIVQLSCRLPVISRSPR